MTEMGRNTKNKRDSVSRPSKQTPAIAVSLESNSTNSPRSGGSSGSKENSQLPRSDPRSPQSDSNNIKHTTGDKRQNKPPSPPCPPDFRDVAEARKEAGNAQFKLQKFSQAISLYTEAIDINPQNPAYYTNRAAAHMALKSYSSALSDMQLALTPKFFENAPLQSNPKNLLRLARCHIALGQFFQARKAIEDIADQSEAHREIAKLNQLESSLANLKRHRERKDWRMLLLGLDNLERELDSGALTAKEWIVWKIEALCGRKKWDEARSLANELVRSHPSDPEVLYCRALLMYSQGNLIATISHCQEAMRCDPDFAKARNLLRQARSIDQAKEAGNVAFKAAQYSVAIKKYTEAAAIDPTNQNIIMTLDSNRAQALIKNKQSLEAIEVCNKILSVDSKHYKALRTRARAKKAQSDFDSAISDLQSAASNAPSEKEKSELMTEIKSTKLLQVKSQYVDHYKVLGVSRDASDDEIKKAFRRQSLIHHPDKGGNEEKFKEVNESYRVLQDSKSRGQFDMVDPDNPTGSSQSPFGFHDDMEAPIHMADFFAATGFGVGGAYRSSGSGSRSGSRGFHQHSFNSNFGYSPGV